MGIQKFLLTKEQLEFEVLINKKHPKEIAKEFGVCRDTVDSHMKKFDIKLPHKDELTGMNISNNFLVIGKAERRDRWVVKCLWCDAEFDMVSNKIRQREIGTCFNCGRYTKFKGYEEMSGTYWSAIKKGAKFRDLDFCLDIKDVWKLFINQDRKCAISGVPIYFATFFGDEQTASLDRINSFMGYFLWNVQWVHKDVNKLKTNFSEEKLIYYCKKIAEHRKDG